MKLTVQGIYHRAIQQGQKTIEGRLGKKKYASLRPGDLLIFVNAQNKQEQLSARIVALHRYDNFQSMLRAEGIDRMLPGVSTVEEGVAIYSSFGGYAIDVIQYGALAIEFELIK